MSLGILEAWSHAAELPNLPGTWEGLELRSSQPSQGARKALKLKVPSLTSLPAYLGDGFIRGSPGFPGFPGSLGILGAWSHTQTIIKPTLVGFPKILYACVFNIDKEIYSF